MKNKSFKCLQSLFLVTVLIAVAVMGLPLAGGLITALAAGKDIMVLYTNDAYCGVDDNIGYAGLALYKKEMQRQTPYVTLVDTGDTIQGAPIGTLSDGGYLIGIMNYVGYDFAVPGNCEFDYGMSRLLELAGKLNCGYCSCNFINNATGTSVFTSYRMSIYGDTQVTFVGVTTPESSTKLTPVHLQDNQGNYIYSFCEDESDQKLYNQMQASVDVVRTKGADYVILVGHLGEDGITQKRSFVNVIANATGVDACIDGHSCETVPLENVKNKNGQSVVLTQMGIKPNYIGKLTISADGSIHAELISEVPVADPDREYTIQEHGTLGRIAKGELGSHNRWIDIYDSNLDKTKNADVIPAGLTIVTPGGSYINEDEKAADYGTWQLIQSIENQYNETLKTVLGATLYELTINDPATGNRIVRNAETNLGDLTVDTYRAELGTDIGSSNGGGIRSVINLGNITYNDTLAVFPYGNMGCAIEATEQQTKDTLEMASKNCPEESEGLLQVSGLTCTIDTFVRPGVQMDNKGNLTGVSGAYRVTDIKVTGEPIGPNRTYTVAFHDYMLKQGGDGMTMFRGCNVIRGEITMDVDILSSYIRRIGGFVTSEYANPAGQGRITIRQNRE